MIADTTVQILLDAGFTEGWALLGDKLILWEHDQEPPAPLVRPQETPDATLTADAGTDSDPE